MKKSQNNNSKPRSVWETPTLATADIGLSDVQTARNFGSDAGNGRTSSGS